MNRRAAQRGGAILGILIVTFVAGVYVDQAFPDYVPYFGHRSVGSVDVAAVQQAMRLVQGDYVDAGKEDAAKLAHSTVPGPINRLGGPILRDLDPTQDQQLQQWH